MKFLLQTQIGVENITVRELLSKIRSTYSIDFLGFVPHKNGIVQIDWRDKSRFEYQNLGTVEDVFFVVNYVKNIPYSIQAKDIVKFIDSRGLRSNIDYFFDVLNPFSSDKKFRFIVRKKSPHSFRRIDLQEVIKTFFNKNIKRVEVTAEEGVKEIWVTLLKNRLIIAIRLTTKIQRQGKYKTQGIPGALRPTVAYAMNFISEIRSNDVVWDPFCGSGTIPCEIVEHLKFKRLICSDISEDAILITKSNLENVENYKRTKSKVSLRVEDFFTSKSYADLIITNLPFGIQHGRDEDFVRRFIDKIQSIKNLRQITVLFPELINISGWQRTSKFHLQVKGRHCILQVLRKL